MQSRSYFLSQETQFQEAIAILKFHSKQSINLAISSYARATKVATYAAVIVFTVMSYFLHVTLLGGNADIITHTLAFILDSVIALVTFIMVREFHPLRVTGTQYRQASESYKKQIKTLEQEMNIDGEKSNSIIGRKQRIAATSALAIADSLSRH